MSTSHWSMFTLGANGLVQWHGQDQRRAGTAAGQVDPAAHRARAFMQAADAKTARFG